MSSGKVNYLACRVTFGSQNPIMGILPAGAYVVRASLHVTEAFNSSGTDNIQCGYDSDNDAYFTNTDVSTTGIKSVTLGAGIGYDTVSRRVEAYYTNSASEPTAGEAEVILEYYILPMQN